MKTRRQYLAYVRKEQAANVSPLFIMNEWEFRGHQTPEEQIAEYDVELDSIGKRWLEFYLAGQDEKDVHADLHHLGKNYDRIVHAIEDLSRRFGLDRHPGSTNNGGGQLTRAATSGSTYEVTPNASAGIIFPPQKAV